MVGKRPLAYEVLLLRIKQKVCVTDGNDTSVMSIFMSLADISAAQWKLPDGGSRETAIMKKIMSHAATIGGNLLYYGALTRGLLQIRLHLTTQWTCAKAMNELQLRVSGCQNPDNRGSDCDHSFDL